MELEEVWTRKSVKWTQLLGGRPISKALNISVAISNSMRYSTGSGAVLGGGKRTSQVADLELRLL